MKGNRDLRSLSIIHNLAIGFFDRSSWLLGLVPFVRLGTYIDDSTDCIYMDTVMYPYSPSGPRHRHKRLISQSHTADTLALNLLYEL